MQRRVWDVRRLTNFGVNTSSSMSWIDYKPFLFPCQERKRIKKEKSLKIGTEQRVCLFLWPLTCRDGYRGMDTFPEQNRECLSCARPAPCIQPLPPCSASMASMSQGHWMRRPRSEYAHQTPPHATLAVCSAPIHSFKAPPSSVNEKNSGQK